MRARLVAACYCSASSPPASIGTVCSCAFSAGTGSSCTVSVRASCCSRSFSARSSLNYGFSRFSLQLGALQLLSRLLQKYTRLHTVWGYSAFGHGHTRYEERMHASQGLYSCSYPVGDVLFRNLARAVEGMPLIESDSVLGTNGNKWEAHARATASAHFCAFDSAQGRAVRNFYTDFANELV